MAELFKVDLKDMKRLQKFYKRAPKAFKFAAASTLSAFAFGTRKEAIDVIDKKMTVRNKAFIHGSIKVERANARVTIGRMESFIGSVERARYTGLAEQQLGTSAPRARAFTRAGRGGVKTREAKGWARLKPQSKYPSPNQPMSANKTRDGRDFGLQGLSGAKRIVAFLMILNERKTAQTFMIRKPFGRFKRGLYRFKQGVIKKIQSFDIGGKPKRIKWLTDGRKAFMTRPNIKKAWHDAIKFQLKRLR